MEGPRRWVEVSIHRDPHCTVVPPAAFQNKCSLTEGMALLANSHPDDGIAHLLRDYSSHGNKNCMVRASAIESSLYPCAKKDARCLASELNSLSSVGRLLRFNLIS